MFDKKRLAVLGLFLTIILLGITFYFDNEIVKLISHIRNLYLDNLFLGVKFLDTEIFVIALLTLLLLWKRKKREWILPLWLTIGITALVTVILKVLIHRARPFAAGIVSLASGITAKASYFAWDFSFPSGDAAFTFCLVPILSKLYPRLKYLWISFAVLVALSRVYFGVHYLSDVIFGSLIGCITGIIIVKSEDKTKLFGRIYNRIFKRK
jgi:undecaprenyl-diphosphatase